LAASSQPRGQSPDTGIVPVDIPQGPAATPVKGRKSIYLRQ
jgi:hypothetical protein